MSPRRPSLTLALGCCLAAAPSAAQVRHRRPLGSAPEVRYGYDNNGSAGGCRDYNCGSRCYDGHRGTDFPVPLGTTVLAGADGTVSATNDGCANYGGLGNTCGGRCGNYVQIQHADGTRTLYCHMQRGSLTVRRGQRVRCGQAIGRSASSGNSTGPHLHFGWYRGGAPVDSFRGRCTSSPGAWTEQRAYGQSPGDRCQCVASTEVCNGRDDDCDGRVDEGLTRGCYGGPAGTAGRGACRAGTQTCSAGAWGACAGQVLPRAEACNRADDDCDGRVDDGVCPMDAGAARDAGADARADAADARADVRDDAAADAGAVDGAGGDAGEDVPDDLAVDDAGGGDDAGDEDVVEFDDALPADEDAGDVAPDDGDADADDGCGCRAGARGSSPVAWAWFALAAFARRRRRARA